jgi:hypothetical protein
MRHEPPTGAGPAQGGRKLKKKRFPAERIPRNRENTGILRVSDKDKASHCFFEPPPKKIIRCRFAIGAEFSITTIILVPDPLLISGLPESETRDAAQIYWMTENSTPPLPGNSYRGKRKNIIEEQPIMIVCRSVQPVGRRPLPEKNSVNIVEHRLNNPLLHPLRLHCPPLPGLRLQSHPRQPR